jgi:hypothetical protein
MRAKHTPFLITTRGSIMAEELLETIIEIQDVEVELYDRAAGEFDQMLADNLHQARLKLEAIYQKIKE